MSALWQPGQPIPPKFSGMPVTFAWNDVALTFLLRALENEYRIGYNAMVDSVEEAMRNYVPPKPPEPQGLGAVVEDRDGIPWVRCENAEREPHWYARNKQRQYAAIDVVRVLSEGVAA